MADTRVDGGAKAYMFGLPPAVVFLLLFTVVAAPSAFFLWASYDQLGAILEHIGAPSDSPLPDAFTDPDVPPAAIGTHAAVFLEYQVMKARQHRASTLLATRTWMRFMSLIFGSVLVVIGAAFVLGRITTSAAKGEFSLGGAKAALTSTSPGLFMTGLGALLIAIPNVSAQEIRVADGAVYLSARAVPIGPPGPVAVTAERDAVIAEIMKGLEKEVDE